MEITYIGHSGFLVELEDRCLLFDYYQGEIPPVAFSRPLYVFVSHRHQDHYNRAVLDFRREGRDVTYIFSGDIMTGKKAEANGILRMRAGDEKEIDGMHVWTLRSTDVGVAFVVEIGGKRLYHAGDLNWWHWEGESEAENRQMEKDYKREIGRLEGCPSMRLLWCWIPGRRTPLPWASTGLCGTRTPGRYFPCTSGAITGSRKNCAGWSCLHLTGKKYARSTDRARNFRYKGMELH